MYPHVYIHTFMFVSAKSSEATLWSNSTSPVHDHLRACLYADIDAKEVNVNNITKNKSIKANKQIFKVNEIKRKWWKLHGKLGSWENLIV